MYAKVPLRFWAPLRRWWLYRDLVQFGHNCGKILLTAHDLPMICLWSACKLQGPPFKMRQKLCTCDFFSIRASRGRPAPARGSPGAGAARAAQGCAKITDLLKKIRFKSWVFVVFQGRRAISKRRGTLPLGNFDHFAFPWVNSVFLSV